jgi:hypothetical protein
MARRVSPGSESKFKETPTEVMDSITDIFRAATKCNSAFGLDFLREFDYHSLQSFLEMELKLSPSLIALIEIMGYSHGYNRGAFVENSILIDILVGNTRWIKSID